MILRNTEHNGIQIFEIFIWLSYYSGMVCQSYVLMNMPTSSEVFFPDIHPLDAICKDLNIESQVKVIVCVQVKWNLSNLADTGIEIL